MSLDKAIEHGKENRKPYKRAQAIDCTCRPHGSCEWCRSNRLYQQLKWKKQVDKRWRRWVMMIFNRRKYKNNSEITLDEILEYVNNFSPIKVTFNNLVLYNDYDSEVEVQDGIYGEIMPLLKVVPDRIQKFKNSIVHSIDVEIVHSHHSIVEIKGEYKNSN